MLRRRWLLTPLVVLAFVLACGGDPPEREMQQAQAAIDTARAAGAEQYASDEFKAAEQALANARIAVEQRDYRLALNHALDSRERAQNATKQTADNRAAERQTADQAISAATMAVSNATTRLKTAESRVAARIVTAARAALAEAEPRLQEARAAYARGEYTAATTAADAVGAGLKAPVDELTAALTPATRRRR